MGDYLTKRSDEPRPVALAWQGLAPGETVREDLGWMIVPQEMDAEALVLVCANCAGEASTAVLRGGRAGHVYHVSNRVRTSADRVLSQGLMLRVLAA